MNSQQKKKAPLVLGILSIVLGLLFPIVGLILGIIGLVLAISYQKESQLAYKTAPPTAVHAVLRSTR